MYLPINPLLVRPRAQIIVFIVLIIALIGISCGGSDESADDPDLDAVQITLPDGVFTADDVAAVGWKKSKELSPETLPGATSVWYGFYQQRDVEVRVYESRKKLLAWGRI